MLLTLAKLYSQKFIWFFLIIVFLSLRYSFAPYILLGTFILWIVANSYYSKKMIGRSGL